MKRMVVFFLILCLMMPSVFALESYPPIADNVPYVMDLSLYSNDTFTINNRREVYRLLDWMDLIQRSDFGLTVSDTVLRAEAKNLIEVFIQENQDRFETKEIIPGWTPTPSSVKEDTTTGELQVYLHWKNLDHDGFSVDVLPQISSDAEFYQEIQKCEADVNYSNVLCFSAEYLDPNAYNDSLDSIRDSMMECYGINPWEYTKTKYGERTLKIGEFGEERMLIAMEHFDRFEKAENRRQARFDRILKNNTVMPIEDGMSDIDKLRIIGASTGNVYATYYKTSINCNDLLGKERAYSTGVGQCDHYARITKDFCDLYGIPCYHVSGKTSLGESHAWNIVQCDGAWYHMDNTCTWVTEFSVGVKNLSLYLASDETKFEEEGYTLNSGQEYLPKCTAETFFVECEERTYQPEMTETMEWVPAFEPYILPGIMTSAISIFCEFLIDHADGTVKGVHSNLSSDNRDLVDGVWVSHPTRMEIPGELNGTRVTAIDPCFSWKEGYGGIDILVIPDGVTIRSYAFKNSFCVNDTLILGDNVTAELDSLPEYHKIEVGENFTFHGDNEQTRAATGIPQPRYHDTFSAFFVTYTEDADITVKEGYRNVVYDFGSNIVDEEPMQTLTLSKDAVFVDPRLGRLNRRFIVPETNPNYTSIDGVLYNKEVTELIAVPIGKSKIEIPDTVTRIGDFAFDRCNALETIVFPASVQEFGKNSFRHLSNIKRVFFTKSVPQSFQPLLCREFQLYLDATLMEYEVDRDSIRVNNPEGETVYTAFYDLAGKLIEIHAGENATEIPVYAKSARIFLWDGAQKPLHPKEFLSF